MYPKGGAFALRQYLWVPFWAKNCQKDDIVDALEAFHQDNAGWQVRREHLRISVVIGCQVTQFQFIHDYDLRSFLAWVLMWFGKKTAQKRSYRPRYYRGGNLTKSLTDINTKQI
jgi:hypothetical protein